LFISHPKSDKLVGLSHSLGANATLNIHVGKDTINFVTCAGSSPTNSPHHSRQLLCRSGIAV